MGLLSQKMDSLAIKGRTSRRSSVVSPTGTPTRDGETQIDDGDPNDTSTLDQEEGNILMSIISQCRHSQLHIQWYADKLHASAAWNGLVQDCPSHLCS